jgi:hypothetical protein
MLTKVEKIFTRKLHVPTKHVVLLADPCESYPSLTIKHLFAALFKIIQTSIDKDEQDYMKETLKKIEKSSAGHEIILATAKEWLVHMDDKTTLPPDTGSPEEEMSVASKLIDWAIGTATCRDDLDSNIEKLKSLKSENTATGKQLRTGISHPNSLMLN